jgi:hypothetical protein
VKDEVKRAIETAVEARLQEGDKPKASKQPAPTKK